ncbi:hypothetical protein [Pragia fontium]|uniref:Phage virion morphogenesis protein n=1 Tax=Pragia fontium DSM 5563 = ATCC 49100 TaxID=1122977 RepID=A0AAJ5BGP0_9GAMM|nr:hypothetical protein [Pragia fontium]SFC49629.1 hypothetical protein SAMN02745723_102508 [Pragia fontium DSM 5563 = ATCC 49100]
MIRGELSRAQLRTLQDEIKRHELPQKKRQRLLWRIAKYGLIVAAKRHQKQQKNPDGTAWKARRRGKKPMLKNLPKLIKIKELPATESIRLYLSGGNYHNGGKGVAAGVVGYAHHNGMKATIKAGQIKNKPAADKATKRQAKKLRALNYQIRINGKYKKAPSSYITNNISQAQAGLLIRILKNKPIKKTWNIELPARVFMGVNDDELMQMIARQLQGMNYG